MEMIDREKVIKAVECRRNVHKRCGNPCEQIGDCEYAIWARDSDSEPYYPYCCDIERLCEDALALLREQEPVKPIERSGFWYCGNCRYALMTNHQKFCSDCGQAVKWE